MNRGSMRYFIGFVISIILIVLLIVTLAGGGNSNKSKVPTSEKPLQSYAATDAQASATIDGPINAPQTHNQIKIIVEKDQITFQQLQGYNGNVVKQQTYGNTEQSFAVFLRALSVVGFTKGNTDKALANEQGYCPERDRYIFQLTQGGQSVERFWSSDCNNPRSYNGDTERTLDLFKAQVPNYNDLTSDVQL